MLKLAALAGLAGLAFRNYPTRVAHLDGPPATDITFSYVEKPFGVPEKLNSIKIFATRGNAKVGVAMVSLFSPKMPRAAVLQYIYVRPEARRTGVAHALLIEALRVIRESKPNLQWIVADVVWTGSLQMMDAVYKRHLLSAGNLATLPTTEPVADMQGVRDTPWAVQVVYYVGPERASKEAMRARFGWPQDVFSRNMIEDFTAATEWKEGRKLHTIRRTVM